MADSPMLKRRLPSGKACKSCRRRKNRCDGGRPICGSCQSRGSVCDYPTSLVEDLTFDELKSLMELKMHGGKDLSPGRRGHRQDTMEPDNPAEIEAHAYLNEVTPAQPSSDPYLGEDAVNGNQTPPASSPSESQDPEGYFGESSTFAFVSKVQMKSGTREKLPLASKRRRLSSSRSSQPNSFDSGLTPKETDNIYELPPKTLADNLVDSYFNHVHRLYPFVHEPSFRTQYERMWMNDEDQSDMRVTWFALLNLIFAHGYEFHDPIQNPTPSATRFLGRSRNIVFAHIFREGNLELVQALLLMCHYLQGTLELNECWSLVGLMIRTSISIGLHLNPSSPMTAVEREVRKRVWWGCFVIDRTLSMKFGRPPSIPTASATDVELPLSVDDQYITSDMIAPRQPAGRPSLTSFFIQTIKLSHIIDRVLLKLYPSNRQPREFTGTNQKGNYSDIFGQSVLLDGELLSWWDEIPSHMKDEPDYPDGPDFQRQRNVIYIRFLNVRLLLHRQSFLIFSRQEIKDKFQREVAIASSNSCILAARETITLIYTQYQRRLLNSLWYNLHYVFTSIGVLLTLRTMERRKLEALGQLDADETLELGMEFLKAASSTSTLASRYVAMLERIQIQPSGRQTPLPVSQISYQGRSTQLQPDNPDPLLSSTDRTPWQRSHDEFQLTLNSGLVDFDDLLFGTGVPRDLLSTDWSALESLY